MLISGDSGSLISLSRKPDKSGARRASLLLDWNIWYPVRVMANAVPHTLFQWSLSCLQFILLFLSFMGTLLSYYTLVFRLTLLSSPPALVLYSSYISAHTYTVRNLYLVSRGINASL